jgi:hypothetical protein
MLDFEIRRGLSTELFLVDEEGYPNYEELNPSVILEEGNWYLCTDTAELFLCIIENDESSLKRINGGNAANRPSFAPDAGNNEAARGIIDAFIEDGMLHLIYSDGEEDILGPVVGENGEDGLVTSIKVGENTYRHINGIISLPEFTTKVYVEEKLTEVETALEDCAKKSDIPNIKDFITKEELAAEGFLKEQSLKGLATEKFVRDEIAKIEAPEVDTRNLVTVEILEAALGTKANKTLFTADKLVTNPVGGFSIGDSLKDLTIADIFAKLLGFSVDSGETPEEPKGIIETIIYNKIPLYQIDNNDKMIEVPYGDTIYYNSSEATTINDGQTGFYVVTDGAANRIEAGYQHFTTRKDPYYIVALPEELEVTYEGNVVLQTWSSIENKWVSARYVLTSDYNEIVATYNIDGIEPPVAEEGYKLWADLNGSDPGTAYRFVIKE